MGGRLGDIGSIGGPGACRLLGGKWLGGGPVSPQCDGRIGQSPPGGLQCVRSRSKACRRAGLGDGRLWLR